MTDSPASATRAPNPYGATVQVIRSYLAAAAQEMRATLIRTDSGGPGRHRGGAGLRRGIRFRSHGEFLSVIKKTKTRPWAVDGGHEPDASQVSVFPGTGREHQVSTKRVAVARGDRITLITAGGGHGDPALRDPEAVQRDVGDGYVPATAPNCYGVEARSAAQ